ncbi:DUF2268 domain-containing putative Zn-dependent protease [Flavobacterium wongokense]|uniref:DUF2268 domain-containing putative Zn-dependent protease n=1 Tax=Flavobacterium wongokense TaxID=2910674 RepID=UPI001F46D9C9|nr:DUF2268 domain-containing putative Zn-dependent protease [Flavobacterium sp. WG47]MCF6131690.1 DUF2268 domain-containing protein [Flavobacterium sp. WG47]
MKKVICFALLLSLTSLSFAQGSKQVFVSTDIDNFWNAYDKIIAAKDSVSQYAFLRDLYLDKATPGLKGMIEVRHYSEIEFMDRITQHPKFWNSIRPNMLQVKNLYPEIAANIQKLQKAYPDLKPVPIYFSVGAFRAGGTAQEKKVLIGSELSLADKTTIIDELPAWRQPFYKTQNPIKELPLLCTHEYIHTQQKELVQNLLSMCLYEGVAEFVSCKASGEKSNAPAIEFGKANRQIVVDQFVSDLFLMSNNNNWIWGENTNKFKVRDLGYYIGYEICERYYNLSKDKTKAIKELIELDYTDEKQVERIVDLTNLFPKSLEELYSDYERQRPAVTMLAPFENGNQNVKPGLTKITVHFSEPLLKHNTGLDFGPLGQDYCPKIKPFRYFSEDGKSWTFEADLQPNQHYQILISNNFRKENGVRLKPYLIEFKTTE